MIEMMIGEVGSAIWLFLKAVVAGSGLTVGYALAAPIIFKGDN